MDDFQWVALVACFVGGYFLISKLLDRRPKTPRAPPGNWDGRWEKRQEMPEQAWYTVLGESDLSPVEDIRKAYQAKIAAYHPDNVASLGSELRQLAEQKSQEINAAYETAKRKIGFR